MPFEERRRFARLCRSKNGVASLAYPAIHAAEVFAVGARYKGRLPIGPAPADNLYAAFSPPCAFGERILTEPPAFSTAAAADFDAP